MEEKALISNESWPNIIFFEQYGTGYV